MSEPRDFNSLKEALTDWVDCDVTAYYLARCLGLISHDIHFSSFKAAVHSPNPVSDLLHPILDSLVKLKALEFDEDEVRYRWNQSFDPDAITDP
jgi:hypothetical protein